jgi:hypothetical protein
MLTLTDYRRMKMQDQSDASVVHYLIEGAGALIVALLGILRSSDADRLKKLEEDNSKLWEKIDGVQDDDRKRWENHHEYLDRKFSDLANLIRDKQRG